MNKDALVKLVAVGGLFGFAAWAAIEGFNLLTKSKNERLDIKDTPPVALPPQAPEPAPAPVPPVETSP